MAEHRVEMVPLSWLHEHRHPENPKDHDAPGLIASFKRFGFTVPILMCDRAELIAAGHGRLETLEVMRDRGMDPPALITVDGEDWLAPTVRGWSSKDDEELLAYAIADNRHVEVGGWITDDLPGILDRLRGTELGLVGVGFVDADVDAMLAALAPPVPPGAFGAIDPDTMQTDYKCPSCSYEWSGQPKPGEPTHEPAAAAAAAD